MPVDSPSELACAAPRTRKRCGSRHKSSRSSSSSWTGAEMRKEIGIIVYAPDMVDNDDRPLAIVRGMERAFPGLRLEWTISDKGQFVPLPQRDAWVNHGTEDDPLPMVCNGDENDLVTLWGARIPALLGPGGKGQSDFHADLPHNAAGVAAAPAVLEAVAETARAFWGHATPNDAGLDIVSRYPPRRGLPLLKDPDALRSPEVPWHLGWLSYWSAAAARVIGFPDPARDAELLSRARHTASGGWVVQLTDEPLDLDRLAHLERLKRAYERFPEIGGRSAP